MLYLFLGTLGLVALLSGALVALMYTWRRDVNLLREMAEQRARLFEENDRYKSSNDYLNKRLGQVTEVLHQEVMRAEKQDAAIAKEAPASTVVDTLRMRLREPFSDTDHTRVGTIPTRVPTAESSAAPSGGPKAQR